MDPVLASGVCDFSSSSCAVVKSNFVKDSVSLSKKAKGRKSVA